MNPRAIRNRQRIRSIKRRLQSGEITYEQAVIESEPVIESINEHGAIIAKRLGVPYKRVTFTELMRNIRG
jgi:hypothetical protein